MQIAASYGTTVIVHIMIIANIHRVGVDGQPTFPRVAEAYLNIADYGMYSNLI